MGIKNQEWIKNNLCNYDLFIQASKNEGLGITAIESCAASVPMILSNIEGHLEISENGKFCQLFDSTINGDLGEKIINFYKSTEKFFELSRENRKYFKNKFDLEIFNKKIIKIYKSINL